MSLQAWNFGKPTFECLYCGSLLWYEERIKKSKRQSCPTFSICCEEGKVRLPPIQPPPEFLRELLSHEGGPRSSKFQENIRAYNSIFAFTSMGANVDDSVNDKPGPYIFRINGQNHHKIGSLMPTPGQTPKFAQLYIYDTENEVSNRMKAISKKGTFGNNLDPKITEGLMKMFEEHNKLTEVFRMARDRFQDSNLVPIRLRLIGRREMNARQHNAPTSLEVAALIVGDLIDTNRERDIVVETQSDGLQRITDLHLSFMAMQYPILFPFGEDGFYIGIPYFNNEGRRKTKRETVTMREYYAYRIQHRRNEGQTILCGRRLFQQFIVNAYTAIEEERLRFIRKNSHN